MSGSAQNPARIPAHSVFPAFRTRQRMKMTSPIGPGSSNANTVCWTSAPSGDVPPALLLCAVGSASLKTHHVARSPGRSGPGTSTESVGSGVDVSGSRWSFHGAPFGMAYAR